MSQLSRERVGELSIAGHSVAESLLAVIGKILSTTLNPLVSLAWATPIAFISVGAIGTLRKSWTSFPKREALTPLILSTLIFGVVFPLATFWGLRYTSAGNAGVILTLEVLFSYLFFQVLKREHINKTHIAGVVVMLLSAVFVLLPNFTHFQPGDLIILLATMIAPLGNLYTKKAKELGVTSEQILLFRTGVATLILLALALIFVRTITIPDMKTWLLIGTMGIFSLGIGKILWVEGIVRIGVTKSASLASVKIFLTLLFAYLLIGNTPTLSQLAATPLAILGVYLLTRPASQV